MNTTDGPKVRLLGVAQDGGLPHAACACPQCAAARSNPDLASFVTSLGIIAPKSETSYLIDATPDIIAQLALLEDVRIRPEQGVDRKPVDGVFLTHAHVGHYLGLAHFGFEAINTRDLPVWCSARMADFLTQNAPWGQLVNFGNLALHQIDEATSVKLPDGIEVTPVLVPHRDEYTDTLAFIIQGPNQRVLFMPDCAPWHRWTGAIDALFDSVDVAFVDGTFYSGAELPGRDLNTIGHPLIVDTVARFSSQVSSGDLKMVFIHLNHSNPAFGPGSEARMHLESAGFTVGSTGLEVAL